MSKTKNVDGIRVKNINGVDIRYRVLRKSIRNIYLRVGNDSAFLITAPLETSDEFIEELLYRKRTFIFSHLGELEENNTEIEGDRIRYLGEAYEIIVRNSDEKNVKIESGKLVIESPNLVSAEEKKAMIEEWLEERCFEIFDKVNKETWQKLNDRGYHFPLSTVQVKTMKSRWGSCSWARKKFSVNTKLIHYPMGCIYSVFYHEYMHYKHHDHSGAFYTDLLTVYPEYRKWHDKLR